MGKPRKSRQIQLRDLSLGANSPFVVQSMCATKTQDIPATLAQIELLRSAGAGLIRLAVDSRRDVQALAEISQSTEARLVVDLQENYRLAKDVAPYV